MSAIAAPAALAHEEPRSNKWLVALSISLGAIMATIDLSIVNVALPQIRGSIGASLDEITAIATSYAIAQVIVMPLTAFLGRFFGQKRVYLFCLGIFVAGSALCGMARTLALLVIARVLQGFGAGALMPSQQAILRQTFPPREQGMAMAVFAMAVTIGPAVGPTLGGWIVDNWSWPWIFYINLPIGVLAILMVSRFVHEPADIRAANHAAAETMRRDLDWTGITLMSVGLATCQYVFEEGSRNDWFDSRAITIATIIAGVGLLGFVIRELRARAPAVNLRLFGDPVFSAATAIGGVMFAVLMASMFLLPVFMQELLGFTALQSGLILVPRALVMMVVTPIVGRIYNHVAPRLLVAFGIVMVGIGSIQMSGFTLQTGTPDILVPLVVQAIGFSFLFVPLATVALSHVARPLYTDASGLNSLVRQFGGSIGLALFATVLERWVDQARGALLPQLDPGRPIVMQRLAGLERLFAQHGLDPNAAHAAALRALDGMVTRQSMMIAFERTFMVSGILMLLLVPVAMFLRDPHHESPAGGAHAEV